MQYLMLRLHKLYVFELHLLIINIISFSLKSIGLFKYDSNSIVKQKHTKLMKTSCRAERKVFVKK